MTEKTPVEKLVREALNLVTEVRMDPQASPEARKMANLASKLAAPHAAEMAKSFQGRNH